MLKLVDYTPLNLITVRGMLKPLRSANQPIISYTEAACNVDLLLPPNITYMGMHLALDPALRIPARLVADKVVCLNVTVLDRTHKALLTVHVAGPTFKEPLMVTQCDVTEQIGSPHSNPIRDGTYAHYQQNDFDLPKDEITIFKRALPRPPPPSMDAGRDLYWRPAADLNSPDAFVYGDPSQKQPPQDTLWCLVIDQQFIEFLRKIDVYLPQGPADIQAYRYRVVMGELAR